MMTILVVDDMPIFRDTIEAALTAAGYTVATASNGAEALEEVARSAPALILLDLGMPVSDGLSVLRALRASSTFRDVPVILLSAETDFLQLAEAVNLGISGCFLKSRFSLKALLRRIREVLPVLGASG